ncbi:MAG: hypothetical protein HY738_03935 [Bacteroidia bacterium]|nr:hypothetical protein [Bacteroidia bacterium]
MNKYDNLAKALYDVGKYAFTVIVIGQFISDTFKWKYLVAGSIFTLIIFIFAFLINKKHKSNG